jgi:hypothetical protein
MEFMLSIFYFLLFGAQVMVLIAAVRKPEKDLWPKLFRLELLSALVAVGLFFFFDALPGRGMAPGLTWFAEVFYSFFAAIGYGLMILVSIITAAILNRRK